MVRSLFEYYSQPHVTNVDLSQQSSCFVLLAPTSSLQPLARTPTLHIYPLTYTQSTLPCRLIYLHRTCYAARHQEEIVYRFHL